MKPLITYEDRKEYVLVRTEREGETVHIGDIYDTTLLTKRDPDKHIMHKWNAYGFSRELLDSGKVEMIIVEEPQGSIIISMEEIKLFSRVERLEGFEDQYFVPRDKFSKL